MEKRTMRAFASVLLMVLSVPGIALAADAGSPSTVSDPAAATAPAQDPADLDERIALAKKMHEINPTRIQIDSAIEDIAARQPEAERETFKASMRGALN